MNSQKLEIYRLTILLETLFLHRETWNISPSGGSALCHAVIPLITVIIKT